MSTRAVSLPRRTGAPLSAARSELGHVLGSTAEARLRPDFAIDYVTNLCYTRFVSSLMRGVSGDDPAGGARRGVLRLAARNRSAGGPDPARRALRPGSGQIAGRLRCHCRRRQRGSPAENRHGGAPRGRPGCNGTVRASQARLIAPRKRDGRDECACRRSTGPSPGDRCELEGRAADAEGRRGERKVRFEMTRARQRAKVDTEAGGGPWQVAALVGRI
jgi:hypothetical protein